MANISYTFDIRQATEAMVYLLSLNSGKMNYMKAIKILYLSDRKSLLNGHDSITTDSYKSLNFGPVTDCIYDCIKHGSSDLWNTYIEKQGYNIVQIDDIEYEMLSIADRETIQHVNDEFRDLNQFELADYCHENLPEWENPYGSSIPINIESIIESGISSPDQRKSVLESLTIGAWTQRNNYRMHKRNCIDENR